MSLDATIWAWKANVKNSSQRLVLLTLADRAGENHKCFPSLKRMERDTKLNRKTIIKVLDELEADSFIKFTGETAGNGVKIYQLIGVFGREDDHPTSSKNGTSTESGTGSNLGTGSNNGTSTNNGTPSSTENGTTTSTNIGTQNLPYNSPNESINKNGWLCLNKLRKEIREADPDINPQDIISANWFKRELSAFEKFNADKNLCDDLMIYHFADRLLAMKIKYEQRSGSNTSTKPKGSSKQFNGLTEKQIQLFADKLSRLQSFSKYSEGKESYEQFASRIAAKLKDPDYFAEYLPYLNEVGFIQHGGNAA